ncbi:MAG TPA: hypothetical protein VFV05_10375 [Methylomirabilota bacterium]|nr:hypothetical protein [Methylomirabilota bacterium]
MKKLLAAAALGTTLIGASPALSHASAAVDAALALGAFAVFNQLFLAPFWARPVYAAPAPVTYTTPAPVYAPGPATYYPASPRPPLVNREVVYPHGRYVLTGDGVTVAYQWFWVPNPPAGAPPPPPR